MKLRNKKTGEIKDLQEVIHQAYQEHNYSSLSELNEDWEDYEEPKDYWWIRSGMGDICEATNGVSCHDNFRKSIGNYFETKEEAKKAVEKLKAWKRLKDKGFKFDGWDENNHNLGIIDFSFDKVENNVWDFEKDLDLIFGGEK